MKNHQDEILNLTPLRGIAALWVLFFHLDVIIFYRDLGPLIPHDATGLLLKGYLWVDFFFILSGFIIAHVYGKRLSTENLTLSIRDYLWARFIRLYPLHLSTLLIAIVVSTSVAYFFPQVIDGSWKTFFAWEAIPSNLLFTHAMNQHTYLSWNIASWSIGAEWWTYVFALPLIILIGRWHLFLGSLIAIVSFSALTYLVFNYGSNKLDITFNYGFFRCLFEFIIGLWVYELYRRDIGKHLLEKDVYFAVIGVLIVSVFHFKFHDLWAVPLFCLLILAASYNSGWVMTLLNNIIPKYIGKISYSIYLMHSLWFLVYWNIFPHIQWTLNEGTLSIPVRVVFVVSFFLLTLLSAHLTYRYIEVGAREKLRALLLRPTGSNL